MTDNGQSPSQASNSLLTADGPAAPQSGASLDDPRLHQAMEEYLRLLQSGQRPDRDAFLARYPEVADALAACLQGLDFVHAAGAELSQPVDSGEEGAVSDALEPAQSLGDFRIVREVGRGGMGVVYEAIQLSLGRRVALKVLPFAATMDPRHLQRFHNEARAAAGLHHEHIVPVHAVGCERGVHFYAMQFIEGQTLAQHIEELRGESADEATGAYSPVPAADTAQVRATATERPTPDGPYFRCVAQWGIEAAEALEYAHSVGVVHRDVKPANLMIDGAGKLWVTDFGLARTAADSGLTMTGDLLGTLRYMSPEQALARHGLVDHRTDVYSLGVTLYELLTLHPAVEGNDRQEMLQRIAFEEPVPPRRRNKSIPSDLEIIVLKAIGKEPSERYATARELADDLRRWLDDQPIRARRPSLMQRCRKWGRRHRSIAISVLLTGVLALSGGTAWSWYEKIQTDEARNLADTRRRQAETEKASADAQRIRAEQHLHRLLDVAYWALDLTDQVPNLKIEESRKIEEVFHAVESDFLDDESFRAHHAKLHERIARSSLVSESDRPKAATHYRQASALYESLFKDVPNNPDYLLSAAKTANACAEALRDLGKFSEAAPAHRRAVSLTQELKGAAVQPYRGFGEVLEPTFRESFADTLRVQGDIPAAERIYRQMLEDWQRLKSTRDVTRTNVCIAAVLADQRRDEEADQTSRLSLKQSPRDFAVVVSRGWFLVSCSNPAFRDPMEAIRLCKIQWPPDRDHRDRHLILALAHYRLGDPDSALAEVKLVPRSDKSDPSPWYLQKKRALLQVLTEALATWQLGDHNKARETLARVVKVLNEPSDWMVLKSDPEVIRIRDEATALIGAAGPPR